MSWVEDVTGSYTLAYHCFLGAEGVIGNLTHTNPCFLVSWVECYRKLPPYIPSFSRSWVEGCHWKPHSYLPSFSTPSKFPCSFCRHLPWKNIVSNGIFYQTPSLALPTQTPLHKPATPLTHPTHLENHPVKRRGEPNQRDTLGSSKPLAMEISLGRSDITGLCTRLGPRKVFSSAHTHIAQETVCLILHCYA